MCVRDTIIKRVSRVMTKKKIIEALYLKRDKRMSRINKFAVLKYYWSMFLIHAWTTVFWWSCGILNVFQAYGVPMVNHYKIGHPESL